MNDIAITYASAQQEPGVHAYSAPWLSARRLDTGEALWGCVEANVTEGWFVQFVGNGAPRGLERVEAPVSITIRPDAPANIAALIAMDEARGLVKTERAA